MFARTSSISRRRISGLGSFEAPSRRTLAGPGGSGADFGMYFPSRSRLARVSTYTTWEAAYSMSVSRVRMVVWQIQYVWGRREPALVVSLANYFCLKYPTAGNTPT